METITTLIRTYPNLSMIASPDSGKLQEINPANQKTSMEVLHQKAFNNSLQASLIFTVADGRIIRANRAACKLLGYSKKELLTKKKKDIFNITESGYKRMIRQRKAEGSAKAELSMIRKNGKPLPCEITSVVFKDENGVSNSIMNIIDLRERLVRQKKIDVENEKLVASNIVIAQSKSDTRHAENNYWIKSIGKTSYDVIGDWDITTDRISFGNNYEKVFGYKLPKNKISFKEWMDFFRPEEKLFVERKIDRILASGKKSWEDTFRFTCVDGSVSQVVSRANILRDDQGKAVRMIGVIHDISKLQKLEETLEQEISIKERQIVEAIVDAKEMERSDIGKELHDNINQLLGASVLYLDMAREDISNGDIYLIHSAEYTRTAIEEIRKLTRGLTTDPIHEFGLHRGIERISRDIMETHPVKIYCMLEDCLEDRMGEKFKLNIFRIVQEQLNNILKHAKAAEVHITFSQAKAGCVLSIADNGIGFDVAKRSRGIGISNIVSRAELYKGGASFVSEIGKGCMLVVTFPAL